MPGVRWFLDSAATLIRPAFRAACQAGCNRTAGGSVLSPVFTKTRPAGPHRAAQPQQIRPRAMNANTSGVPGAIALSGLIAFASVSFAQSTPAASAAKPYKIINTAQTMGAGGIDYVYADNDG